MKKIVTKIDCCLNCPKVLSGDKEGEFLCGAYNLNVIDSMDNIPDWCPLEDDWVSDWEVEAQNV